MILYKIIRNQKILRKEIKMGKIRKEDDLVINYKESKNIKERNQNGKNQGG